MTDRKPRDRQDRFGRIERSQAKSGSRPSAETLFDDEIGKISTRVRAVIDSDRADFYDGSATYDHASLVIVRLAAMLEDTSPFKEKFAGLDDESRRGIIATRNIIAHTGYASMDDDVLWHTITVDIPDVLRRFGLI